MELSNKFTWKLLLESILYGVIATVLFGIIALLPFLNISLLLLPIPYIFLCVRRGWKSGLLAFLVTSGILTLFPGIIVSLLFILLFGPCVAVISILLYRKTPIFESVIAASGTFLLSLGGLMGGIYLYLQQDLITFMMDSMRNVFSSLPNMDQLTRLYQEMGVLDSSLTSSEALKAILNTMETYLRMIFPSALLISSIIAGFINYYFSLLLLKRKGIDVPYFPAFSRWELPRGMGLGFVGIFSVALVGSWAGIRNFELVSFTVVNLFSFIFMVQGLAVGEYYLKRSKVQTVLRVLILVISFFVLQYVLVILGMVEQLFHIRRLIEERG